MYTNVFLMDEQITFGNRCGKRFTMWGNLSKYFIGEITY